MSPKTYVPVKNDNISRKLAQVPGNELDHDDGFADVVSWNLSWFHKHSPRRVRALTRAMAEVNADLFVFQNVALGALDAVLDELRHRGLGDYHSYYGTSGGVRAVAFVWDRDFVRPSRGIFELFNACPLTVDRRLVFPRLPLHANFTVRSEHKSCALDALAVQLWSARAGAEHQRKAASKLLAGWIKSLPRTGPLMVAGDWDWPPDVPEGQGSRLVTSEATRAARAGLDDGAANHLAIYGGGTLRAIADIEEPEGTNGARRLVMDGAAVLEGFEVQGEVVHAPLIARYQFPDVVRVGEVMKKRRKKVRRSQDERGPARLPAAWWGWMEAA